MRLNSLFLFALTLPIVLVTVAEAQPRPRAEVYRDQDFRGDRRILDGEVRDFNSIGLNDRVSSIRVDSGTWQFCEDANFQGRCFTLNRDEPNLAGSSMDDRISSARPVADRDDRRADNRFNDRNDRNDRGFGRGDGPVTLYADINFSGASRDAGESRDFRNLDFNDTVSSIRIRAGSWQFCTDADFKGKCMTFDRDVPSLVPFGMNDAISSMRRVR